MARRYGKLLGLWRMRRLLTPEFPAMSIKRFGTGAVGAGGQPLPFARAVEADGWLHVSGQVAMENGNHQRRDCRATHKTLQTWSPS